jgi:putative restriction endonuclease
MSCHTFEKQTAALPRATEVERLVVQRVGQDLFRNGLLDYWEGRCAITRLAVPQLLRASHIRPWADCTAEADWLDVLTVSCLRHILMPPSTAVS